MAYGIEMLLKSSPTGFGTLLNMSPHSPWTVYVIDARMYGRLEQLPEATHDSAAILSGRASAGRDWGWAREAPS